jgi:hypothetical protein
MNTVSVTVYSPEQAEIRLFGDALSCELDLPVQFRPGLMPLRVASATLTLKALAQVDDIREIRQNTSSDERTMQVLPMARLDAKLDLVLMLLARIVRQSEQNLSVRPVRWSRHGIRLEMGQRSNALTGSAGILCLQPADWLPEYIELPAIILSEGESERGGYFLWLRFDDLGPTLEEALERHLFRLHRHLYAETRHPND